MFPYYFLGIYVVQVTNSFYFFIETTAAKIVHHLRLRFTGYSSSQYNRNLSYGTNKLANKQPTKQH
jgi:L-lysine 2,3-aminomutase